MKQFYKAKILFLFLFLLTNYSFGQSHMAVASADWNNPSTWNIGTVPGINDNVIIDGHTVYLSSGTHSVNNLTVTNTSGSAPSFLNMNGSAVLTITQDLVVESGKDDFNVDVLLGSTSIVNVLGNVSFTRASNNTKKNRLRLDMANTAKLIVANDFLFSYANSHPAETSEEIFLNHDSNLEIGGSMNIAVSGGSGFEMTVQGNSIFTVGNHLVVNGAGGDEANIFVKGQADFTVDGDLTLNNSGNSSVLLEFGNSNGSTYLHGDLSLISVASAKPITVDIYGGANVNITDHITLRALGDGDVSFQINGTSNLFLGGNIDRLDYGAFTMQNSANLILNGTTTQTIPTQNQNSSGTDEFFFTNLELKNTSNTPLPLEGPMTASTITTATSQFKAEYYGDPPPWGGNLQSGIDNISGSEYWEVSKTSGSDNVNITIHWDGATNITNTNDLIVARLNVNNQEWENYGNSGTTGNTTTGSVTSSSLMGDPPPWGSENFTLGSRTSLNALPVELTKFQAIQQNEVVNLTWETASELNTEEFIIEHSNNGYSFDEIGSVFSSGNSSETKFYSEEHRTPNEGINYYRLKIVDLDGSFEYSHIEVVKFDKDTELNIFPNPVTKFLHIHGELILKVLISINQEHISFELRVVQIVLFRNL